MKFYTVIYLNDEYARFSVVVFARSPREAINKFYSYFCETEFRIVEVLSLADLIDCRIESDETTI